ncbi:MULTISPECIES: hypothetical protein [unclassified Aureispira]|uniref:hypothetical protein n=1 Tax=unclassified Aureispira TaxID=2649989 RepID=UPI0012DCF48F|nr:MULTISPECIES: hypothetical protein [unclassified Aureispira]WMX13926.1 hypothetical protein QP953_24025 [Aureispira sp. CCB-E]
MRKGCGILFLFMLVSLFLNLLPFSCNNADITEDPVRLLIEQESMEPMFTILLFDMDQEGVFSKTYKHRYRVIKEENGKVVGKDTKWYNVPSSYFQQNENNLGMEMAAKDSTGKIARTIGPPGYTNYIGNPRYGYWGDGTSQPDSLSNNGANVATNFWYFYPKYTNIRELLQLPAGKIYQKDHKEARNYYNRGFIYYGIITSGGRRRYGTYSNHYRTNTYNKRWSRGGGGYGK